MQVGLLRHHVVNNHRCFPASNFRIELIYLAGAMSVCLSRMSVLHHPPCRGNDPVPPQTFWCEMHQGADVALTAEDSQLSASLALLSKDALIARVVAAEGKVAKYRHKVQQIQDALADHS